MRREPDFAVDCVAERVGFEPTVPFGTTVFETVRIGHSRTSPRHSSLCFYLVFCFLNLKIFAGFFFRCPFIAPLDPLDSTEIPSMTSRRWSWERWA